MAGCSWASASSFERRGSSATVVTGSRAGSAHQATRTPTSATAAAMSTPRLAAETNAAAPRMPAAGPLGAAELARRRRRRLRRIRGRRRWRRSRQIGGAVGEVGGVRDTRNRQVGCPVYQRPGVRARWPGSSRVRERVGACGSPRASGSCSRVLGSAMSVTAKFGFDGLTRVPRLMGTENARRWGAVAMTA